MMPRPVVNACLIPSYPWMKPAVGKVRPLDRGHQLLDRDLGVVDHHDEPVDDFAQVVRRDVRGHADRDAGGAVDQQVRHPRRKHRGLDGGIVEVRDEIDGLLVDIGQQLLGQLREPRLGIPVGRCRVAVNGAEVALPVHQQIAHVEVLRHPDHGVVDRAVAVGMVLLQHFADHAGALGIFLVVQQSFPEHGIEDAPMHRLQAVAHVRKRPPHDHAHGVIEVGGLHLLLDVDL